MRMRKREQEQGKEEGALAELTKLMCHLQIDCRNTSSFTVNEQQQ